MKYQKYNFETLDIYHLALSLLVEVYKLTKGLPKEEMFALISQIKRAAISVVLNIAEGSGRGSKRDFARFINQSIGSLFELKASFHIAKELKYLKQPDLNRILPKIDELFFKLSAFKKSLETKGRK